MIGFLLTLASITGGILLGLATLDRLDGDRDIFNKLAGFLAPFQTIIGISLLVLSVLTLGKFILYTIIEICAALLLLTHAFGKVPSLESSLTKFSDKLMPFKAVIGIALLVLGIYRLVL